MSNQEEKNIMEKKSLNPIETKVKKAGSSIKHIIANG